MASYLKGIMFQSQIHLNKQVCLAHKDIRMHEQVVGWGFADREVRVSMSTSTHHIMMGPLPTSTPQHFPYQTPLGMVSSLLNEDTSDGCKTEQQRS